MAKARITVTRATALAAAAIAIAVGLMYSTATLAAGNRGVEVKVRTSEATNAPVADIVQLYGASHALVIGIDKYTNGWPRLSKAVEDARVVAKELERQGFQVTLKTDLTADALRTSLREFFAIKGADPDARLLLWYAGHGDTIGGEGYLVPADAPPDNSPAFLVRALPMRDFGSLVRLAQSKHVLSVFDSCFSGTIFQARAGTTPRAITKKTTKPVRQFVTSGDAGQQVRDDGSFREYFVRALRGEEKADFNADGYVTGEELGLFLNQQMTALTSAAQTPKAGKLHDVRFNQGDFVFVLPHRKLPPLLPGPIATVPLSDGGFDLGDLEQRASAEEKSRTDWSSWQQSMSSAFGTVEEYVQRRISSELKVAALDKFLEAFEQNNPYSSDDETLRENAEVMKSDLSRPSKTNGKVGVEVDRLGEGLELINIRHEWVGPHGSKKMVVSGAVSNVSDVERPIPMIRVEIADTHDVIVQSYVHPPNATQLPAGKQLDFKAHVGEVVPTARRVHVRFADEIPVLYLQRLLHDLGYSPGPTDGVMKDKTRTAIKNFQRAKRLPVSDTVTDALLTELKMAQDQLAVSRNLSELKKALIKSEAALSKERAVCEGKERELSKQHHNLEAVLAELAVMNNSLKKSEKKNKANEKKVGKLDVRLATCLAGKVEEMARYRSEFFGRLRRVLGDRRDIRIVGDRFVFQSEVLFGSGEAVLGGGGMVQLRQFARTLGEVAATIPSEIEWVLRVDGHTDRIPIHNKQFASNWELSTARAVSVVKFLIDSGIPAQRLFAAGFGQFHPLDSRNDELGYRRNRRIEFKLGRK